MSRVPTLRQSIVSESSRITLAYGLVSAGFCFLAPFVADRIFGVSSTMVAAIGMAGAVTGLLLCPVWLWYWHDMTWAHREALVAAFFHDVMARLAAGETPEAVEHTLGLKPGEARQIMRYGQHQAQDRMLAQAARRMLELRGAAI